MDLVTLALAKKYTNEHGGVAYTDHSVLTNRDAANAHTIGSVTGLQSALDSKADAEDVPTKTSDLVNDSGFATETYVDNAIGGAIADAIGGGY